MSSALLLEAARATAPPRAPASPLAHFFQINRTRGLVAGALLGAGAAFLAWGFQTWPDNEGSSRESSASSDAPATEITAEGRLRSSPASAARATRNGAHPAAEELPVILQTDDLPRAPDDGAEEEEGGEKEKGSVARSSGMAGAHAGSNRASERPASERLAKSDPKPIAAAAKAESTPASKDGKNDARPEPAAHAAAAAAKPTGSQRRETASHNAKHTSASADCNPPYFFDNNNIRRLKLECL